jgi:acetyl/propionyl-CoA carboxylase alpha subunit
MLFEKVLVANRGEIAVRVMKTLRRLGIRSVAVYSEVDECALHVGTADQAINIGGAAPAESYLNGMTVLDSAEESGAEAVHPGYGFLSENPAFAKACEERGFKFVGPSSETLTLTGDKLECKKLAMQAGVPVIPGSESPVGSLYEAEEVAERIGYPVMLKTAYGGGGLGIREVTSMEELGERYSNAVGEAMRAFGRASMYVEKIVTPARHVEVQILADGKGRVVPLGERECSIQRRHQKLIEMTPSPAVDDPLRERLGRYAVTMAERVGYENAGTAEFLLDGDGSPYFLEVNSRIQVEHPVTEMVTGLDLVAEQLAIAAGEGTSVPKGGVERDGAAIECRVNAEDPLRRFLPSSGVVRRLSLPKGEGVRVDSSLYQGCEVPVFYDSLVAKVIAHGRNLEEARRTMVAALDEFEIEGLATTIPLQQELMSSDALLQWDLSTDFIPKNGILDRLAARMEERRARELRVRAELAAEMTRVYGDPRSRDLEN